jgi:hypothetical protein
VTRDKFESALRALKTHFSDDVVTEILDFVSDEHLNINHAILTKVLGYSKYSRVDGKMF